MEERGRSMMTVKTDRWWMAALPFDWNDLSWLPLLPPAIRIEEYRSDDRYVVRAELPGVDPDLHVHRDASHVEATRSEFQFGSFSRTVSLPPGALTDQITARYTRGILEITV